MALKPPVIYDAGLTRHGPLDAADTLQLNAAQTTALTTSLDHHTAAEIQAGTATDKIISVDKLKGAFQAGLSYSLVTTATPGLSGVRGIVADAGNGDGVSGSVSGSGAGHGVFGHITSNGSGSGVSGRVSGTGNGHGLYGVVAGGGAGSGVSGEIYSTSSGNGVIGLIFGTGGGSGVIGQVVGNGLGHGVSGVVAGAGTGYGVSGSVSGSGAGHGAAGQVTGNGNGHGVSGSVSGSGAGHGVSGQVTGNGNGHGVEGQVNGNGTGNGGRFLSGFGVASTGTGSALYVETGAAGVRLAAGEFIAGTSSTYAAHFTGAVFSSVGFTTSDKRLKRDIKPIDPETAKSAFGIQLSSFEKLDSVATSERRAATSLRDARKALGEFNSQIEAEGEITDKAQLQARRAKHKELRAAVDLAEAPATDEERTIKFLGKPIRLFGAIAQDVQVVAPDLVQEDRDGSLIVNETALLFTMLAGAQAEIAELKALLTTKLK